MNSRLTFSPYRCGALPVDDVDNSLLANISSSDMPKMVLVEVDGLQMYYPSCLVGVLAEEMLPRSAYQGENASEGCKSDDAMEEEEQPAEALSADAKRKEVYGEFLALLKEAVYVLHILMCSFSARRRAPLQEELRGSPRRAEKLRGRLLVGARQLLESPAQRFRHR